MSLTAIDKKEMREMMIDTVTSALEELVIPRFVGLEGRMSSIEGHMSSIEGRMDKQEQATNNLRDEMRSGFISTDRRTDDLDKKLSGKIEAIENDVKEIYAMINKLQTLSLAEKKFAKLSLEQKILKTHARIVIMAKEAGIKLPT
jgi:hypothetical protein